MRPAGNTAHLLLTALFIVSGLSMALFGPAVSSYPPQSGTDFVGPAFSHPNINSAAALAWLYLRPQNLITWALTLTLWGLLLLDALGNKPGRNGRRAEGDVALPLNLALLTGAILPWLFGRADLLAGLLAVVMMLATLTAAHRSASQNRPAIGFLAGWATGPAITALAALIAGALGLDVATMVSFAMVPTTLLGVYVQSMPRIRVSYSIALIWTFVGLAASTAGHDPMIALAAIFGTAVLAIVLIRAAT